MVIPVLNWFAGTNFEGKEYAGSDWLATWHDANASCIANNAALASVGSVGEDDYLRGVFPDTVTRYNLK